MAATVDCALAFLFILTFFISLGRANRIVYGKEELLNFRRSGHGSFKPVTDDTSGFSEILAAAAIPLFTLRRRGRRAGALVRWRQRGKRAPLPALHLLNARSLGNKLDELRLLCAKDKDF